MSTRQTHAEVLVIGGGPAGITFCRTLKRIKPKAEVIMLRPEKHSMVYCAIPYAIEGIFDPAKVFKKDELVTGAGALLSKAVRKAKVIAYPELATEAIMCLELDGFPAIVANDIYGGDLFIQDRVSYGKEV